MAARQDITLWRVRFLVAVDLDMQVCSGPAPTERLQSIKIASTYGWK
jgi:hypothetical protein